MDTIMQMNLVDSLATKSDAHSTIQSKHRSKSINSFPVEAAHFDKLPDCGFVRLDVVLVLLGCSKATLWRMVKSSHVPSPKKLGRRISAWNVGEIRSCLATMESVDQGRSIGRGSK